MYHFREVEVGESAESLSHLDSFAVAKSRNSLLGNLSNWPPTIAAVMPPPLPALLPNQEPRGADLHSRGLFWGILGRIDQIEEGWLARRPGLAEDMQCRLARPRERTDDD